MNTLDTADSNRLPIEARGGPGTLPHIMPGKLMDCQTGLLGCCCEEFFFLYFGRLAFL